LTPGAPAGAAAASFIRFFSEDVMDIGFIGLGRMGQAIAANLIRAGHRLTVWNRSAAPAEALRALGASLAADPPATARGAVLMTMLADDDAHRDVLIRGGVFAGAAPGLIYVNLATVSVALARELAGLAGEHGLTYLAAPVFGRPEAAQAAKLNIVAAGDPAALSRMRPVLQAIGERVWPLGPEPERANAVKLAGNFLIASALESMGEAAALVRAHGVSSAAFLDILTSTLFACPVYKNYGRMIAEERYEPAGFTMTLGLKDTRLALQAAEAVRVPMPLASVVRDHFIEGLAAGKAEQDWSALADISAQHAGLKRAR
jgi:3-hydroxyisobutyrate dehydrogenase-like beta-hydroxyacid dehydrogenase